MFLDTVSERCKVNLSFSLFAIRNLVQKAIKPIVTVKLTIDVENEERDKWVQVIKLVDDDNEGGDQDYEPTNHPNFGKKVSFKDVPLKKEPLIWPYLSIAIEDLAGKGIGFIRKGCETCYTTISLITFAEEILSY